MSVMQVLRWLLLGVELVIALPVLYLSVVTISAMVATRQRKKRPPVFLPPFAHFALLVPAYNEAVVLEKLLRSLAVLDYPVECYTACLVADNCTDATAELSPRQWSGQGL